MLPFTSCTFEFYSGNRGLHCEDGGLDVSSCESAVKRLRAREGKMCSRRGQDHRRGLRDQERGQEAKSSQSLPGEHISPGNLRQGCKVVFL
jgi:hypothetical protein